MQAREIEALGREIVPGRGSLKIEQLSSGLLNESYRIERDAADFVLKVARPHPPPGLEPEWGLRILESAGRAAVAPSVVYADPARGVVLLNWIDGRSCGPQEANTLSCDGTMADLLRRVHALPVPAQAPFLSPASWMEAYRFPLDALLCETAVSKAAALAAHIKPAGVVCHSDLHLQNLLERDGSLLLLDWEYAHVSDPLWDVAGWSANNDFDTQMQREFMSAYLGKAPNADEWARFRLLYWLYDYVCLLWSGVYLDSRRDHAAGIAARATLLDARLRNPAN
jgi:thiamine kinase